MAGMYELLQMSDELTGKYLMYSFLAACGWLLQRLKRWLQRMATIVSSYNCSVGWLKVGSTPTLQQGRGLWGGSKQSCTVMCFDIAHAEFWLVWGQGGGNNPSSRGCGES